MNAPLPLHVTRSGPQTYEQVARVSNEVAARLAARLRWLLPGLRLSIALMWIVTGIVSVA